MAEAEQVTLDDHPVDDGAEQARPEFGVGRGDRGGDLVELGFTRGPIAVGGVVVREHGAEHGQRGHRLAVQTLGQRAEQGLRQLFRGAGGQFVGGVARRPRE
jgi:hypothetical protein